MQAVTDKLLNLEDRVKELFLNFKTVSKEIIMKKRIGLLFLGLFLLVGLSSAQASVLTYGTNKIFYNNYETVFRADDNGDYYEIDQTSGPVDIAVGDIFVGIINVQDITDVDNQIIWDNPDGDQITGIFAQEITALNSGGSGIIVDLAPTSETTFTTLAGDTFTTGLASNEMFELYYDAGGSTSFTTGGSIVDGIAAATDGTSWMVLGDDDTTVVEGTTFNTAGEEYAWTDATPFGTPFVNFNGDAYLGLSVLEFESTISDLIGVPLLNDPTETRFDSDVEFYANSELTVNPDFVGFNSQGTSQWVFESNDPGRVAVVPEPTSALLLGIGLLGAAGFVRRKIS